MTSDHVTANLVEFYANLDYAVNVKRSDCGTGALCWVATNPELPGCRGQGATEKEAISDLSDARRDYIASMLDDGVAPPLPASSVAPAEVQFVGALPVEVLSVAPLPVTRPMPAPSRDGNWVIDGQIPIGA